MAEADSSSGWTEGRRLEGAKWERPRPGMVLEAGNRVEESEERGGGGARIGAAAGRREHERWPCPARGEIQRALEIKFQNSQAALLRLRRWH
jgi:hypothetical protein